MDPNPILPASCLVAPVVWELDADTPLQCPAKRLYVPSAVRDRLIYWAHTTLLWSSWDRSDGALCGWEVLVAYLGQGREGLCFLLIGVRSVYAS